MEFIKQLFSELNTTDSITILAFLFGAWLLGLLFGRMSLSGKLKRMRAAYQKKEADYKMLNSNYENLQNTFKQRDNDFIQAKQQLRQLKLRNQEVEKEMTAYKNQYATMHNKFSTLQTENEELKAQLEEASSRLGTQSEIHSSSQNGEIVLRSESDTTDTTRITQFPVDGKQMIPGAYDTDDRLAAIEDKLEQLTMENTNLRDELSRVKTPQRIVASDGTLRSATTTIRMGDRSTNARTALSAAIGTKIKKASATDKDDLKKINGIGPFIEEKLNKLGIYTYEQISQLDKELVDTVTDAIQFFPGRIDRDDWVGQASSLKA